MSSYPGPLELGRGVVISAGGEAPSGWERAPRVVVNESVLLRPESTARRLHDAWSKRSPVVVELEMDPQQLRAPEKLDIEPYELDPTFEFIQERIHFLVWANNYDATKGEPIWWHARLAQRLGATPHPEAEVDIDGPKWCDGGPRGFLPFPVLHRESIQSKSLTLTFPQPQGQRATELDAEQRLAVTHQGCAARVLAPAGSGKTRVLTERFRYLLDCGFEADRVTALAYNKRAALEMVSRLHVDRRSVRTLHSMGYGLLRRRYGSQVANASQIRGILRSLVTVKPQLNTDPYAPYLEALQRVRLALVDPETVEAEREDIPEFSSVFRRYRERLKDLNLVDHDEQIYGAIELLLQDPDVRASARRACTHLLVDEFQDLTPAFLLLIRLLNAPGYQLFGVGDDDQVIYGYTGATPEYLVNFDAYFPGSGSYLLATNYRCSEGVIAAANSLLARNKVRIAKTVRPGPKAAKQKPSALLMPNETWTVKALQQIEDWLTTYKPTEIAVLARVNAILMPLQVALHRAGIPHQRVVDVDVLQRTGIRSALAYWRLARDLQDFHAEDLQDALRRPNRRLRREIMDKASNCRSSFALQRYAQSLDPWPCSQLEEFLLDVAILSKKVALGPAAFFQALRTKTEFVSSLEQLDASGLGAAGSSHQDDLFALEQLAVLCDTDDFESWLRESLVPDVSANPASKDEGIRLSSVHRVKGLEWPCVLIYGAEQGLFPHRLSEEPEEERRLFHVAITRSREHCTMLATASSASPFLAEMEGPPKAVKAKKRKKRKG